MNQKVSNVKTTSEIKVMVSQLNPEFQAYILDTIDMLLQRQSDIQKSQVHKIITK